MNTSDCFYTTTYNEDVPFTSIRKLFMGSYIWNPALGVLPSFVAINFTKFNGVITNKPVSINLDHNVTTNGVNINFNAHKMASIIVSFYL